MDNKQFIFIIYEPPGRRMQFNSWKNEMISVLVVNQPSGGGKVKSGSKTFPNYPTIVFLTYTVVDTPVTCDSPGGGSFPVHILQLESKRW